VKIRYSVSKEHGVWNVYFQMGRRFYAVASYDLWMDAIEHATTDAEWFRSHPTMIISPYRRKSS
jgi:hypothetical protein